MADNSVIHNDSNIERLVRNILNHPTFRTTVNQILHNANSNIRTSTEESADEVKGRFASPATELSSLFRQDGSSNNNSATPVIQRAAARSEVSPALSLVSPNENINRNHLFQRGTNYQQIFPLSEHEQ